MYQNLCDTHTHTLYSRHSYSTIRETVLAARDAGLELLASTDHFSCMLYPDQHMRNFQFFYNYSCWPREWEGVTLLHGCEADIVDLEGNMFGHDIPVEIEINGCPLDEPRILRDDVFKRSDYVIASVHDRSFSRDASLAATTQMYLNALRDPKVLMLAHTGRSAVPFDIPEVVGEAKRLGKLIEINEHSLDFGRPAVDATCKKIAETCAELGCKVAVNTDAHICVGVGHFDHALAMLEEIHFPPELIATASRQSFLAALDESGIGAPAL